MTSRKEQLEFNRNADAKRFHNRVNNPWLYRKEQRLAEFVSIRTGKGPVLEIGCGEGSNLVFLRQALPYNQIVGMDWSEEKIAYARGQVDEADLLVGDALSLAFSNDTFETVLCRDLLHHVDFAKAQLLTEALRVTKPKGRVIIMESHGHTLVNLLMQVAYPAERGMYNSTPESLCGLAAATGYEFDLCRVECSQLVRAIGFFLGWTKGRAPLHNLLYGAASFWERGMERVLPGRFWASMALVVEKYPSCVESAEY